MRFGGPPAAYPDDLEPGPTRRARVVLGSRRSGILHEQTGPCASPLMNGIETILAYFHKNIPWLLEVSIGHALIADALYLGLENAIQIYKRQLTM